MLLFLPYYNYLDYMDYSYAILPATCTLFYTSQYSNGKRLVYFTIFIIGIIEMLVFGARAPVVYCFIYVIGCIILYYRGKSISKRIIVSIMFLLLGIVLILQLDKILAVVSKYSLFAYSYIIRRFLADNLISFSSRELIWESCISRLKTMGLYVGGFFGDRAYCIGVYPHNIALEILMSWGWIIGSIMLLVILIIIIKSLRADGAYRDVAWFFLMTGFSRFLFSGTYVREGKFWITLFVVIAVNSISRKGLVIRFNK